MSACSFFGHRNVELTRNEMKIIRDLLVDLIENKDVDLFLFGSRSNFDFACHQIITDLKCAYPNIIRVCYTCKSETCTFEKDREYWEKVYSKFEHREIKLLGVEREVEHKNKWTSGKASYVERNYAMIDDSEYCIFYYDENYKVDLKKQLEKSSVLYLPKSGTALAYNYAKSKGKIIYNVFDNK